MRVNETTYGYWEATYPLVNEAGLGFGESTCAAKMISKSVLVGGNAHFTIGEVMRVAIERCATSRCAIDMMGKLTEEYGFYGEDPGGAGAGEAVTVVDPTEAWIFHITGGIHNRSANWVAQRVPDNHVSVVANQFVIKGVDCQDKTNFMCSTNMFSDAKEAGLCEFETEAEFDWTRCYGADGRTFNYLAGQPPVPYYMALRVWRVLTLANPSLGLKLSPSPYDTPFSVPALNKLDRTDIMNWQRDHYENTDFDMREGVLAGPYGNPNRIEGGDGITKITGWYARGISIPRTVYGTLVAPDVDVSKSIAWFASDSPASSVFVPFFAGANDSATVYRHGRAEIYSRDSAFWAFNFVANWMNLNYQLSNEKVVAPAVKKNQEMVLASVDAFVASEDASSKSKDGFNAMQSDLQNNVVDAWRKVGDIIIAQFSDGVYRTPEMKAGAFVQYGYPEWYLQMIGFDNSFFMPQWVQWSPVPPPLIAAAKAAKEIGAKFLAAAASSVTSSSGNNNGSSGLGMFFAGMLTSAAGFAVVGAVVFRRETKSPESYTHLLG